MMEGCDMWISTTILNWRAARGGHALHDDNNWRRPYEILAHAESIILNNLKELDLVDAVTTLKRAVDHRLRAIKESYPFQKLPIKSKPNKDLALLEYFGIIRHNMLLQLIQIRNRVEHEDASPPRKERCQEFADTVWYFLRTTDILVKETLYDYALLKVNEEDTLADYSIEVKVDLSNNWAVDFNGLVSSELISTSKVDGWIETQPIEIRSVSDVIANTDTKKDGYFVKYLQERQFKGDDVLFRSRFVGKEDELREIIKLYFIS